MVQAGGKSCYNSHCDVGMILVRQDFPLGMPFKPVSIRGSTESHYGIFGLIKVLLFLWLRLFFLENIFKLYLLICDYYFYENRTKQMAIGGWNLVIMQKKSDFGRHKGFLKALETESSGEEKCLAQINRVLKWDMDFFQLLQYIMMHMSNVLAYLTIIFTSINK